VKYPDRFEAAHVRHEDVNEHQVERTVIQCRKTALAAVRQRAPVPRFARRVLPCESAQYRIPAVNRRRCLPRMMYRVGSTNRRQRARDFKPNQIPRTASCERHRAFPIDHGRSCSSSATYIMRCRCRRRPRRR
jgi:hypothetical protein